MKFPFSWLKEYLPTNKPVHEIAEALNLLGLEVEEVDDTSLPKDAILEVALTPNLGHCASVMGMARELTALTQDTLTLPQEPLTEDTSLPIEKEVKVEVFQKELCPRYSCRLIKGVKVQESPEWLKNRLEACGIRSVNNVVDITNYVMLERGHPLHAFDFDTLEQGCIQVRLANPQEAITTLDQKKVFPTENTLLIADAKKAVAIAGVMGSLETEVGLNTTNILLEAAIFEPTQVRRTSKRMTLKTDASKHFERGVDPNGNIAALNRAAALIAKWCGGKVAAGIIDTQEKRVEEKELTIRPRKANALLGTKLSTSEMETMLERLNFTLVSSQEENLVVKVPTYRIDVQGEIDLIEEIARMYGFDNLYQDRALSYREGELPHAPFYLLEKKVRHLLIGQGLQEFITSNLISKEQAALISADQIPSRSLIHLLNPTSVEQSVLRPSLLPSLLSVVKKNHDHSLPTVQGFEIGKIHFSTKETFEEPTVVALVISGKRAPTHFDPTPQDVDFFDLKGIVENFFDALQVPSFSLVPSSLKNFHPQKQGQLKVEDHVVGIMGQVHPATLEKVGLDSPLFFAEIDLLDLSCMLTPAKKYTPLPRFPATSRDLTLTLKETCPVEAVLLAADELKEPLLESLSLLDVYRSEKLGSGWKNITFRFIYRDRNGTLAFEAIEKKHREITQHVIANLEKSDWIKRG